MVSGKQIRRARLRAGLSQTELARRAGTSQATVSAYESDTKRPSTATLERLLGVAGARLEVRSSTPRRAGSTLMKVRGERLAEVLALAESLPARRKGALRYPRLDTLTRGDAPSRAS